jgi:general secretion pathway protein I
VTHPGRQREGRSAQRAGTLPRRSRGFTLVEVLVALGIVAIALVAGLKASAALTSNAQRQSDVLLAHMCAENELVRIKLSRQLPSVGDSDQACEEAGQAFTVRLKVSPTPNPNFRRVDAQVFAGEYSVLRLSTVMGRY